jgi:hypothetical protein
MSAVTRGGELPDYMKLYHPVKTLFVGTCGYIHAKTSTMEVYNESTFPQEGK